MTHQLPAIPDLLRASDLVALLRVSKRTANAMMAHGLDGKPFKVGHQWRLTKDDFVKLFPKVAKQAPQD